MKKFKISALGIFLFVLIGCASKRELYIADDGNYYLTGDANCMYAATDGKGKILCYKADGKTATEYRYALSEVELDTYMQEIEQRVAKQSMPSSTDFSYTFGQVLQTLNSYSNQQQQNAEMMQRAVQNTNYQQNYNWGEPQRNTTYCRKSGYVITCY